MAGIIGRPLRALLLALTVLAVVAGCTGSGGNTFKPNDTGSASSQGAGKTQAAENTPAGQKTQAPANNGGGNLSSSVSKLSDIKSYKFKMVMKGGSYGSMVGDTPITGTVIMSPEKAAEMSIMGMEVREVGGKSYVKMGTGWIESTDPSQSSMADSFAPEKMFGSYISSTTQDWYKPAGEEQKNGVATVHYKADTTQIAGYGSMLGVKGSATWSADLWIAKQGGYPVSMSLSATGGDTDFLFTMDITNVNDPANKVEVPKL